MPSAGSVRRLTTAPKGVTVVLLAALIAIGVGACGGDDASPAKSAGGGAAAGGEAAALLPSDVKDSGKLTIATFVPYPPYADTGSDGKTLVGLEPELAHAIAAQLGVEANLVTVKNWDQILPGLSAGRYDAAMAAFLDNAVKHEQYLMVDYFHLKVQLVARAGLGIDTVTDLCGKKAALQKGSAFQVDFVEQRNKECAAAGRPKIDIVSLPDQNLSVVQMQSGRVDFEVTNVATATNQVKENAGKLEAVLEPFDAKGSEDLVAMALPKDQGPLAKAVQAALKAVIADGTYDEILHKWGLEAGGYKAATINGAG